MAADNTAGSELATRFTQALHSIERDGTSAVDAMVALFAESATLTNAALLHAGEQRVGRAGARTFWNDYASIFTGARTEFSHMLHDDASIGLFWKTRAASGGGGVPAPDYEGATLIELDPAGAIIRFHGYYDTRALEPASIAPDA